MGGGGSWRIASKLVGNGSVQRGIYKVLDNERRRYTLYYLLKYRRSGPQSLGEMAEQIAAWENDIQKSDVSAQQRKRVYNSLQQFHLTTMAEFEIIRYDENRGTVKISSRGRALARILFSNTRLERVWRATYLIVGIAGAFVALAHIVGLSPLSSIDPAMVLLTVSLLFVAASVGHRLHASLIVRLSDRPPSLIESTMDD